MFDLRRCPRDFSNFGEKAGLRRQIMQTGYTAVLYSRVNSLITVRKHGPSSRSAPFLKHRESGCPIAGLFMRRFHVSGQTWVTRCLPPLTIGGSTRMYINRPWTRRRVNPKWKRLIEKGA